MNPFLNLVGLRGVTNSNLNPRMWVNDIPGIDTELVGDLASTSERYGIDEDAADMWQKIQRSALDKLEDELLIEVSAKGDFQPVLARLDDTTSPSFSTLLPINSANALTGLRLELPYTATTRLDLESVSLCVAILGSGSHVHQLSVYDLNTGIRLLLQDVTLSAGVNTIPLTLSVNASLLTPIRVAVLLNNAADVLLTIPAPQWTGDTTGLLCESVQALANWTPAVDLLTGPGGLTVAASWTRSVGSRLVRYTTDLVSAYRLLCGSLLLTQKMATPNMSLFTLSNRAFSDKQEDKLYADAKKLIKVVARRMVQDWASETVTPTLTERTDFNRIEIGSYV